MPEPWVCPRCGNPLSSASAWHQCTQFSLDALFARSEPKVRALFDRYAALVHELGEVTVIPQKTRVSFEARVRFASAQPRKGHLVANFWLRREMRSPRFRKVEHLGPSDFVYQVRIEEPEQLDAEFMGWIREARELALAEERLHAG